MIMYYTVATEVDYQRSAAAKIICTAQLLYYYYYKFSLLSIESSSKEIGLAEV